jgi:hypothetical protein
VTVQIPTGAADITAQWLSDAIGPQFGSSVKEVEATPVGTGQIADTLRLKLSWDAAAAGPETLIVKVTSSSDVSKAAAIATRTYEVEVGFYTDLAPSLPVKRPECYWAGYDAATGAYACVLEDAHPAFQGDQLTGCTIEEAEQALREAALLHGPRANDPELLKIPWLNRQGAERNSGIGMLVSSVAPAFIERYNDRLSPDVVELVKRVVPRLPEMVPDAAAPTTIVHGDFRIDNLLFGTERVWVLDWQTLSLGEPLSDVSYFLGGSLLPEVREKHEEQLVAFYRDRLAETGVELEWDDVWRGYRRHAFSGLIMAIIASALVVRTDRGDSMFIAMGDRAGKHALHLDAEALIGKAN